MTWRGGTGEAAGSGQGRAELVRGVEAEGARPETLRVGQGGGASGKKGGRGMVTNLHRPSRSRRSAGGEHERVRVTD